MTLRPDRRSPLRSRCDITFAGSRSGRFATLDRRLTVWSSTAPTVNWGGPLSSAFVAKAFTGAKLVKGFNHLGAAILATDPVVEGGHRVVFLSSDDEDAISPVADLAKQLGFAPIKLGKLNEGGALVHARGRAWGQLIFQDVFKKQQ
jgi:8-hydroxy-5-deazaflavin:NADPH oxidoreductase